MIFIKIVTTQKGWFLRVEMKVTKMTFDFVSKSIFFLPILFD